MKIKIKKQLSDKSTERITKRFKHYVVAFTLMFGSQYIASDLFTEQIQTFGVSADGGQIFETDYELERNSENRNLVAIPESKRKKDLIASNKYCATDITSKRCPQYIKDYKDCEKPNGLTPMFNGTPSPGLAKIDIKKECWNGQWYERLWRYESQNGYVEEFYQDEHCYIASLNIPGTPLLSKRTLGIFYFIFLFWLFLGISVIADIFMEAIEVITSTTKDVQVEDQQGKYYVYQVPIWNPTIANLTLMALGSSAPEILLSVIESLKNLGLKAGELGPGSIVGSGAFNLLVITGISILSVDDPKKIHDLGVYSCTATFSVFAYFWMYIVLEVITPGIVDLTEAWLTFFFFFLLVGLAFGFDKLQQSRDKQLMSQQEILETNLKDEKKIKKSQLRNFVKGYGELAVITIARGTHNKDTEQIPSEIEQEIKDTFKQVLEVKDLKEVQVADLKEAIAPEALLERFAAKKASKIGKTSEFLEIKAQIKGQLENDCGMKKADNPNEYIYFKCLHYSVTESNEIAVITVVKRAISQSITFGVRTVEGGKEHGNTAVPHSDYTPIDIRVTMNMNDNEKQIEIPIIDNNEWEPDLDFIVELYEIDAPQKERLNGDDTQCRVTILDEDFPGTLGFEYTDIRVNKNQERVDVVVKRSEGSDGRITCIVKTESLSEKNIEGVNAVEFEDYLPKCEKVVFEIGEMDKTVPINLVNDKVNGYHSAPLHQENDDQGSESNEVNEVMFKVKIEKPEPKGVKISKRNCAIITIVSGGEEDMCILKEHKLLEYFLSTQDPTWGQQFKNALSLGPQIDEDDMIVTSVTLPQALMQFLIVFWKIIFSFVPPIKWGGGKPAFIIALSFIGIITGIVGEVATTIGCVVGIPPNITAITIVAIGTSLPDTFASVTAARSSEYADAAVGNVTGSNSVNVFLGLGLPWVISAMYASRHNKKYEVPTGELAFSVAVFLVCSIVCFVILTARRIIIGGELGGPKFSKYLTAGMCMTLWVIYILMSILNALKAL